MLPSEDKLDGAPAHLEQHMSDRLGLNDRISRRDFLNGVLLTGAGLLLHDKAPTISPEDAFNGYVGIGAFGHTTAFCHSSEHASLNDKRGSRGCSDAGSPYPRLQMKFDLTWPSGKNS